MRRRDFVSGIAGSAVAWPLAAHAQQSKKVPRLGILLLGSVQSDAQIAPFLQGLSDLGYVDGKNVKFEYRRADGRADRLSTLASELVALNVDVMVAFGGDVAPFARNATQKIPIVFAISSDPVQLRLVESLNRPGGNATGVTFLDNELGSKRLEILKEAVQKISRVAFLWNPDHLDNELREAEHAAQKLALQLHSFPARNIDELKNALGAAKDARVDAFYIVSSTLMVSNMSTIIKFTTDNRLPVVGGWGAWAAAGALLSYGPDVRVMVRRTAIFVDKILKGARPADLPVEQPTKFQLIVNLKVAKAMGLTIPEAFLLLRADEVID